MAILSTTERISAATVPLEIRLTPNPEPRSNLQQTRESAERESILKALEQTNWNVSGAARVLGIERTNLHKRIRALGISKENL
jgi:two-component system nitrogen regulation response regulator NtrX